MHLNTCCGNMRINVPTKKTFFVGFGNSFTTSGYSINSNLLTKLY